MRRSILVVVAVVAAMAGPAITSATASERPTSEAECLITRYDTALSPGVSQVPTTGTFTSQGFAPGVMDCHGTFLGSRIVGPGTVVAEGRYGTDGPSTCTSGGAGISHQTVTLPTAAGVRRFEMTHTFNYGGLRGLGPASGTFASEHWSGEFTFYPLRGDCATAPITAAGHVIHGTLRTAG